MNTKHINNIPCHDNIISCDTNLIPFHKLQRHLSILTNHRPANESMNASHNNNVHAHIDSLLKSPSWYVQNLKSRHDKDDEIDEAGLNENDIKSNESTKVSPDFHNGLNNFPVLDQMKTFLEKYDNEKVTSK